MSPPWGHLWGANRERGLYKTTDGGKTWQNILFLNEATGVVAVALDPQSPNTLYGGGELRYTRSDSVSSLFWTNRNSALDANTCFNNFNRVGHKGSKTQRSRQKPWDSI